MRLTRNFQLDEFLISQTAERQGIDMTPPNFVIENLRQLTFHFLQPLRDIIGSPIRVTSGYRPLELNIAIGGSKTSQHMEGKAVDFQVPGMTPLEVCQIVFDNDLPFDQLIREFRSWVHASYAGEGNRMAKLTAELVDGKTQYTHGIA
jgi:hypothetical protein